jgi:hypothetical protein
MHREVAPQIKEHDDVVLRVGNALKDLGTVCADIDSAYAGQHEFAPKFVLAEAPRELLSALIPTQMIFTRPRMPVLTKQDWKEPDLAVKQAGFAYILDVFDDNDSNADVARKIETAIVNSAKCKIVGLALVAKGINKAYTGAVHNLKRVRETFHLLFGSASTSWGEEDLRTYLQPLFSTREFARKYRDILWDRILRLSVADDDWEPRLRNHVRSALASKRVMASSRASTA